jgi:hypothetical protein
MDRAGRVPNIRDGGAGCQARRQTSRRRYDRIASTAAVTVRRLLAEEARPFAVPPEGSRSVPTVVAAWI